MKKEYLSDNLNYVSTNMNIVRFIAATLVIFCHSFYVSANINDPLEVFSKGQTNFGGFAVAIFFFLSGMYVTKSMKKMNSARHFIWKRCIRIFPQLWIVVVVSVFILGPIFSTLSLGEYFSNKATYFYLLNGVLLPIHNLPGVFESNIYDGSINGPLWTMPVEFAAYCILAVVMWFCITILKKKEIQKYFHILITAVMLIGLIVANFVICNEFLVTVLRPMVCFFVGTLYCEYADKIVLSYPVAVAGIVLLIISCRLNFFTYAIILCLPYIVVTFALKTKQCRCKSKLLLISYEMYLVGWPIQQMITYLFGGEMNQYLNFAITMVLDVIIAYIIFVNVEMITKKVGKKNAK